LPGLFNYPIRTIGGFTSAKFLNVHINTVRRWSDQGIIKTYRIGPRGDRRFAREDVMAFLAATQQQPAVKVSTTGTGG
jgi:excisionase family DNA binding protein